jgi:hypothetical protein
MVVEHHTCRRCVGRGSITVPLSLAGDMGKVGCPVCLGLGEYETNDAYRRPDVDEGYFAVHSNITLEEAIALLPQKEEEI